VCACGANRESAPVSHLGDPGSDLDLAKKFFSAEGLVKNPKIRAMVSILSGETRS
jgi:hypothetical protein